MNEAYKIKGLVARDSDGSLNIHQEKPSRQSIYFWMFEGGYFHVDKTLFPELTWNDEPIEVELLIRKI